MVHTRTRDTPLVPLHYVRSLKNFSIYISLSSEASNSDAFLRLTFISFMLGHRSRSYYNINYRHGHKAVPSNSPGVGTELEEVKEHYQLANAQDNLIEARIRKNPNELPLP